MTDWQYFFKTAHWQQSWVLPALGDAIGNIGSLSFQTGRAITSDDDDNDEDNDDNDGDYDDDYDYDMIIRMTNWHWSFGMTRKSSLLIDDDDKMFMVVMLVLMMTIMVMMSIMILVMIRISLRMIDKKISHFDSLDLHSPRIRCLVQCRLLGK